ncbi:hypothetical protein CPB86DRAFT_754177 [Serendipita vermifera]|nr:hypothetical protein CPB86DRAFT_754177 [Serendipita vermifera]
MLQLQPEGPPLAIQAAPNAQEVVPNPALLAQFFACPICQDIMSHPYTIVDCMHKFDKHCLVEFWKTNACCPLCKVPSSKAAHDFNIQGIVDNVSNHGNHLLVLLDNAPIYPSPIASLGYSRGFSVSMFDPESQHDMESVYHEGERMDDDPSETRTQILFGHDPMRPGGNLVFPCDSCLPGNNTGYQCSWPIPMPTTDEINHEIRRTGRVIRPPQGLERRAPLSLGHDVPGINAHLQCEGCSMYVPRQFPANIRCTLCRSVYCGEYTRKGNCNGISLHPANGKFTHHRAIPALTPFLALVYKAGTMRELVMDSFPELIRLNRDEMERLEAHLTHRNLTPQLILQQIVEANERAFEFNEDDQFAMESQGAPKENPWTQALLCTMCIESLVRVKASVWNWWVRERASDNVHPSLKTLPNCWYGWECRTQIKSFPVPTHSSRFNVSLKNLSRSTPG